MQTQQQHPRIRNPRRERLLCRFRTMKLIIGTTVLCQYVTLIVTQFLVCTRADWIDIDTPINKRTTKSKIDGTVYQLVRVNHLNIH
jgi:hypothetical protein